MTTRARLIEMHQEFHGREIDPIKESELGMIVDILEQLIERSDEQKDHSHSIR